MQKPPSRQLGQMVFTLVLALMISAAIILISEAGFAILGIGKRLSLTTTKLETISNRLAQFDQIHGRLPCPANGAANNGLPNSDPNFLTSPPPATCSAVVFGVVPWVALGLKQEDVVDEWGRLISYRVFDGAYGLTQASGATATDCDTNNGATPDEPPINGVCNPDHNTPATSFLQHLTYGPTQIKGLVVSDYGTNVSGVAYVLISHGPSGLGGFLPSGIRMPLPDPTARDFPNTLAAPTSFIKQEASSPSVVPGTTGHYDDLVYYMTLPNLLIAAKQQARDWPEPGSSDTALPSYSAATTANMTTPSVDSTAPHWMTSGVTTSGEEFTALNLGGVWGVGFGDAAGAYSGCNWWPIAIKLVDGTTRRTFRLAMQFAAADNTIDDPFYGLTIAFLSGIEPKPTNSTCGSTTFTLTQPASILNIFGFSLPNYLVTDTSNPNIVPEVSVTGTGIPDSTTVGNLYAPNSYFWPLGLMWLANPANSSLLVANTPITFSNPPNLISRNLGWAGGTLARGYTTNRFAVEFDAVESPASTLPAVAAANDPGRPHLAIDQSGVVHGTNAQPCVSYGYGSGCNRPTLDTFPGTTKTATGAINSNTITITDPGGIANVLHGMTVSGTNIAAGATVTQIFPASGLSIYPTILLSAPNVGNVTGTLTFSSISSLSLMKNGLTVYHNIRLELTPLGCVTQVSTGPSTANTITVADASSIALGMGVYGTGIAPGATVSNVNPTTRVVTLSIPNTGGIGNEVYFGWPPTTTKTGLARTTTKSSVSGTLGQFVVTVPDVLGIALNMSAVGDGIGSGAVVTAIAGTNVTLSVANPVDFSSGTVTFVDVANANSTTKLSVNGTASQFTITIPDVNDIRVGMSAVGTGLGVGAKVINIAGSTVTLSVANSSSFAGSPVIFSDFRITVSDVAGIALGMFATGSQLGSAATVIDIDAAAQIVTLLGNSSSDPTGSAIAFSFDLTKAALGNMGDSVLSIPDPTGLQRGMSIVGAGIPAGTTIASSYVPGSITVPLFPSSNMLTQAIVGNSVTFSNAYPLTNTLIKSWALSNAGCATSPSVCAAFNNTDVEFSGYLNTTNQALHVAYCLSTPFPANAFDSLYFGTTSANVGTISGQNLRLRSFQSSNSLSR